MNDIFDQVDDYDYDDNSTIEAVLHDSAWGFCDPKCFVEKKDLLALDLQEVHSQLQMGRKGFLGPAIYYEITFGGLERVFFPNPYLREAIT